MPEYRPSDPFTLPIYLLRQESTKMVKGVKVSTFSEPTDDDLIWCSFKTFGGTEKVVNGVYSIENTATVETWYRPDIKSDCRIRLAETGEEYENINDPENVKMRNQYCIFKVKRVKGGV